MFANCECIVAGKTNIMPYAKDRVAFHGYKLYELTDKLDKNGNKSWAEIDEVEGVACAGNAGGMLRNAEKLYSFFRGGTEHLVQSVVGMSAEDRMRM